MKILKLLGKPFTALAGSADQAIKQKVLLSVVRHGVTLLGGVLVTHGWLDMSHTAEFAGAVLSLVAMFSGAAQKVHEA